MNYIWEVLLSAQESKKLANINFIPAKILNPYMETAFDDLNQTFSEDILIEVNGWYRFASVFESLLSYEMDQYPQIRNYLFDIFIHLLGWLDLRSGLSRTEYYGIFIRRDIDAEIFGKDLAAALQSFSRKEKSFLAEKAVRLYTIGSSIELLRTVLRRIYPKSMLYLDTDGRRDLLIYVGEKNTMRRKSQMEFICCLFIPFDYDVKIFWDRHFGIIGVDETMEINEIELY